MTDIERRRTAEHGDRRIRRDYVVHLMETEFAETDAGEVLEVEREVCGTLLAPPRDRGAE